MPNSSADLVAEARTAVPDISADDARHMMEEQDALLLDVRDLAELQSDGRAEGAHHVPRGMLEFRADPSSKMHDDELRPARPVILYCASGDRAALAGRTLRDMGYEKVYTLGGLKDWVDAGGPHVVGNG